MEQNRLSVRQGDPLQPGVNKMPDGYNFAVEAPLNAKVQLLLYQKGCKEPVMEIPYEKEHRIGGIFAMKISGLQMESLEYNFSVDGKIVQDPYAVGIVGREVFGAEMPEDPHHIRCSFLSEEEYEWEDETSPSIPYENMILYKLHVRGYTMQYKMSPKKKGTFSGLMEMIPYWQELGINAIELMPAYEFMEMPEKRKEQSLVSRRTGEEKVNFWGYLPGCYFAPKRSYCAGADPEKEVKDFIKALHAAGLECIMEMYVPKEVNAVLILRALQFWKMNYHVDGFHLVGEGVPYALLIKDRILADAKLFFQEYDSGKEITEIPETQRRLAKYSAGFLPDMRRFLKSDSGMLQAVRHHIKNNSGQFGVINHMVSQDGFTLNDLTSYNQKHNHDNGEENQDGTRENYSWNCGAEGSSRKKAVCVLRERQQKNAVLMMLLCQGVPMIYGGDEVLNSQEGNNNAYCQDNPVGWTDWSGLRKKAEFHQFVKDAIAFRKKHPVLHMTETVQCSDYLRKGFPDLSFHGEEPWYFKTDHEEHYLGVMYCGPYAIKEDGTEDDYIYAAFNFHWEEKRISLPNLPQGKKWWIAADSSRTDVPSFLKEETPVSEKSVKIGPRSIVLLTGR